MNSSLKSTMKTAIEGTIYEIEKGRLSHLGRMMFLQSIVNDWNKLPRDVAETSSTSPITISMFKSRLEYHRASELASSHHN